MGRAHGRLGATRRKQPTGPQRKAPGLVPCRPVAHSATERSSRVQNCEARTLLRRTVLAVHAFRARGETGLRSHRGTYFSCAVQAAARGETVELPRGIARG